MQEEFRVQSIRICWPDLNVLFEAHRPIVDAICAGDQALAEDAAKAHLDAVWYRLAESTDDVGALRRGQRGSSPGSGSGFGIQN